MERINDVKDKVGQENAKLKQRLQAVQQDWTSSFKTMAHKANKKARQANRKARKVLGTEDGRPVRNSQVYNCNLNLGYDIFKRFQRKWIMLNNITLANAAKADEVDIKIFGILKQWQLWDEISVQFQQNIVGLPDIVAEVEIAQATINTIGDQMDKIDDMILQYEDILERVDMAKLKEQEKFKISQLVEAGQHEYQKQKDNLEKDKLAEKTPVDPAILERQSSVEKQKTYEDAFLEQMNRFVESGELDTPIAGKYRSTESLERITIDEADVTALKEFLGPEELDSVMKVLPDVNFTQDKRSNSISNQADDKLHTDVSKETETNIIEEKSDYVKEDQHCNWSTNDINEVKSTTQVPEEDNADVGSTIKPAQKEISEKSERTTELQKIAKSSEDELSSKTKEQSESDDGDGENWFDADDD